MGDENDVFDGMPSAMGDEVKLVLWAMKMMMFDGMPRRALPAE